MSQNLESQVENLTKIVEETQKRFDALMTMLAAGMKVPASSDVENKQERVDPPEEKDESGLLDIAPLHSEGNGPEESTQTPIDVDEELVEDEIEPEVVPPTRSLVQPVRKAKKDSFMADSEVLEEGQDSGARGGKACIRQQLDRSPRKNRFRDNLVVAKVDTLAFDKKVRTQDSVQAHNMIEKRPPVQKVIVSCLECHRRFKIDAQLAPQRLGDGGDGSSYQCDSCILRKKG